MHALLQPTSLSFPSRSHLSVPSVSSMTPSEEHFNQDGGLKVPDWWTDEMRRQGGKSNLHQSLTAQIMTCILSSAWQLLTQCDNACKCSLDQKCDLGECVCRILSDGHLQLTQSTFPSTAVRNTPLLYFSTSKFGVNLQLMSAEHVYTKRRVAWARDYLIGLEPRRKGSKFTNDFYSRLCQCCIFQSQDYLWLSHRGLYGKC